MTRPRNDFDLAALLTPLARHGVPFVVIGGVAAIARGVPTVTVDVDVVTASDRQSLEHLSAALVELDARLRTAGDVGGVPFPIDADMLATGGLWTLTTPYGDLDLVFVPDGTQGYDDVVRSADTFVIDGLPVPVAALEDVIRMKQASAREKDLAVLPLLRRTLAAIRARQGR